ncbi:protein adenylyltransferase Fic-like isoform X2 [Oscarella lobularis]|uniref:protein adenylyltransferase Fic-like isoform X2 n=1 Tax=Oscarella lobularis TaxID=121494 RepID=UPI0033141511
MYLPGLSLAGLQRSEAVLALNQARRQTVKGNRERALKLFNLALNADPNSPDVLTEYGNFIEIHEQNVVKAQQMYTKALVVRPDHVAAQESNVRAAPLVQELDRTMFERIDWKKGELRKIPVGDLGSERTRLENYFLHVYHTVAIEGNTMTLSMTRSVLESGVVVPGKTLQEHNEVQGISDALHFMNESLLYKGRIDLDDILLLHLYVFGRVQPNQAGHFRAGQVFVGNFKPPPPDAVPGYMRQFSEWLESSEARALHPIARAAMEHYKLVWIHPFVDGNGRTARLLMNLRLMQNGYPPVIVKVEERHEYYEHLQTANDGDVRPFVRFIGKLAERTVDEYISAAEYRLIPEVRP